MTLTKRVLLTAGLCLLGVAVPSMFPARGDCPYPPCCEFTYASASCGDQHGIKYAYLQWVVNTTGCGDSYLNIFRRCEGQTEYTLIDQVDAGTGLYADQCPIRCPGSDPSLEYRLQLVCPHCEYTMDNAYVNTNGYCCD